MKPIISLILILTFSTNMQAQEANATDYYYKIPANPTDYTATNVVARMVDGLGFRYYWASEGLRQEDLAYKPNEEARSIDETLDHILSLSTVLINSVTNTPNIRGSKELPILSYQEKRAKTLNNIKRASDILKSSSSDDLATFNLVFQSPKGKTEYPFWNQINGPIEDAVWHAGQVASMRRAAGTPFDSKVSLLSGERKK